MFRVLSLILLMSTGLVGGASAATGASSGDARSVASQNRAPVHQQIEPAAGRAAVGEVTPDRMMQVIQKYLEDEWAHKIKTVSVSVLEPSDPIQVSGSLVELRVIPGSTEESPGRRIFQVEAVTNNKLRKTVQVLADVTAMIDAVVPGRFLRTDEVIEAGDLKTARTRVYQVNHPFVTDQSEVIGRSATRPLPPDAPLRSAFVKLPLVVKKGDRVLIQAQRGGLSIRAYGITKSSGQVGQSIMVANLDSGRELRATVVAPSIVQVEF
ncbi:MAG: flagellar basal body P-ring formation protein FlgA [Nitrospira sp.]